MAIVGAPRRSIGIDPIYTCVTLIEEYCGRSRVGSATGFFYRHGESLFLVTNRHVLIDEEKRFYPDTVRLRLHTNKADLTQNEIVEIGLYTENKPTWIDHPSIKSDLSVIELDASKFEKYVIAPLSKESLLPEDVIVNLGDSLTVLGFPLGFYDRPLNLPIARTVTFASPYPTPFQGQPYFLVEGRLHEGTSGGPVLYLPRQWIRRGTSISPGGGNFLLGVHSGGFEAPNPTDPFDLNVAWFAELLEDALDMLRPLKPRETESIGSNLESESGPENRRQAPTDPN